MSKPQIPQKPFEKIALSCSGGGYRAATFHLGTMSYLNKIKYKGKPLLENVRMISTVSGGTITGAVYALMKQDGKSFEEIYEFIRDKLSKLDLVKDGIEKLNPDGKWNNPYKRKNLINAFAELYDEYFTQGRTFESFSKMNSHLEAVVFNSTDFSHGLNFRFRNKGPNSRFGNNYFTIPYATFEEVRISDAIASSSAFPGGFEPLIWPHDFVHPDAPALQKLATSSEGCGIMDGGIYDNQGIDSLLSYKSGKGPYFDLILISDVSSPDVAAFVPYTKEGNSPLLNLDLKSIFRAMQFVSRHINKLFISLILIFGLLPLENQYSNSTFTGVCISIAVFSALCMVLKWGIEKIIQRIKTQVREFAGKIIPPFYQQKLSLLKADEIKFGNALPLIADRVNSLILLLSEIFLKIVRRLNYYKIYDNDAYSRRRITTLIKELTKSDYTKRKSQGKSRKDRPTSPEYQENTIFTDDYKKDISPAMLNIAEQAAGFGTTLWFTEKESLDELMNKLIACGQFTMCFNLLEYLEILLFDPGNGLESLEKEDVNALNVMYQTCLSDWKDFKVNPLRMV